MVSKLWRREDGVLLTVDEDREVTCSWTLTCARPATDIVNHPTLGGVPVCTAHKDWAEGK